MEKMDKNIKKHADRGWELMSQKLDLEMPQARKKRGLGWLWPWAAGCLFVAWTGFYFFMKNGDSFDFSKAEKSAGLVVQNLSESAKEAAQLAENQLVESNNLQKTAEPQDVVFEKNSPAIGLSEPDISIKNLTSKGVSETAFQPKNFGKLAAQPQFAPHGRRRFL